VQSETSDRLVGHRSKRSPYISGCHHIATVNTFEQLHIAVGDFVLARHRVVQFYRFECCAMCIVPVIQIISARTHK